MQALSWQELINFSSRPSPARCGGPHATHEREHLWLDGRRCGRASPKSRGAFTPRVQAPGASWDEVQQDGGRMIHLTYTAILQYVTHLFPSLELEASVAFDQLASWGARDKERIPKWAIAPATESPINLLTETFNLKFVSICSYEELRHRGVRRLPEVDKSGHSVHYTLLIACVLVAFLLGAIVSGFLVSCYCSYNVHRTKRLGKDPEASISHALSLRSLAKLNGLLDGPAKDEKLEMPSPKLFSPFLPNGKEHLPDGSCRSGVGLDLSHQHHNEELSGLPTPDSTPELPIKSMKAFRNQWEKNQNCNNAKESRPLTMGCSRSNSSITQQAFPFSHGLAEGQALGAALHLDERKIPNAEQMVTQPYACYPQTVVDVSALDELLKHIHEAKATSSKNLTILTSSLLPSGEPVAYGSRVPQIPDTESAPYYSSSTLPRDSLTRRLDVPPDMPLPQSAMDRVSRHNSQRLSLMVVPKMGNGGGVPRQQSFGHRSGHQQAPLLSRMNSAGSPCEAHHPLMGSSHLTRQHSYNEQPQGPRGVMVRRSTSLKPDPPPKPLFIPATSPVSPQGKFNY
ncbi:semaphorin-6D-like isoform X1 [Arapaima gigas]